MAELNEAVLVSTAAPDPVVPETTINEDGDAVAALKPEDAPGGALPKLHAGKYKTVEELEAGYKELEKKLGAKPAEPKVEDAPAELTAEAVTKAGLSLDEFSKEFAENGELSEESYKALEDKGFTREVADRYIEGQKAVAEKSRADIASVVGGTETLDSILEWDAANVASIQDEAETYNAAVESGNPKLVKAALKGVMEAYNKANGTEPDLDRSGESRSVRTGVQPFLSTAQMTEAISDPRYARDPAYRDSVGKRIEISQFFDG